MTKLLSGHLLENSMCSGSGELMALFEKLEHYLSVYDEIHSNRDEMRDLASKNQKSRKLLYALRKEMRKEIIVATKKETLYRLCLKRYGKIDKHFHTLFTLFADVLSAPEKG